MEQYLIDTKVVSDYFSALLPDNGMLFMDDVIDNIPNPSVKKDFKNIKGLKVVNPYNV